MKAIIVTEPGGPETLQIATVTDPVVGPDDILIKVIAAGLNRADLLQRQGHYPPPPGASDILGLEVSGRVEQAAAGSRWNVGDEVCALLSGGGYAETVAAPQNQILPIPNGVSALNAAALPEAAATVYYNLVMKAGLKNGETLLVHGGGSGIGTMAIQIARNLGAKVACTAGSAQKLELARELGAEILINYHTDDFADRMKAEGGADVILDIIGAKYLSDNVRTLKPFGRIVTIGLQGGRKGDLDLARLLMKQGSIMATSLRALHARDKAEIVAGVEKTIWPMFARGDLKPIVADVLPIEHAAKAHAMMSEGRFAGKLVLGMDGHDPAAA